MARTGVSSAVRSLSRTWRQPRSTEIWGSEAAVMFC